MRHEEAIAHLYGGERSRSSGGAVTDEGDVRVTSDHTLFECKGKFGELAGDRPVRAMLVKQFEKIADEAWAVEKEPAIALRFYCPESVLADTAGWVDVIVRLADDDAYRSDKLLAIESCVEEGRWH